MKGSARRTPWEAPWPTVIAAGAVLAVSWIALALTDGISGTEEAVFRLFNDLPDWLERPTWLVMQFGAFTFSVRL